MKKLQDSPSLAFTSSEEEMIEFGRDLALDLKSGAIVALHGDLGAGKTTLAKGAIAELGSISNRHIQSPTFTYLNIYDTSPPIYHFDLYRLKKSEEFVQLGFLDYLGEEGICLIEWPERISALLPFGIIHVEISHLEEGKRKINVYKS